MPLEGLSVQTVARAIATRVVVGTSAFVAGVLIFRRAVTRVDDGFWAFVLALVIPLMAVAAWWLVLQGLRETADRRALEAVKRSERPRDGAWTAVAGVAKALEDPIAAALSGREALACRYQVFTKVFSSDRHRAHRETGGSRPVLGSEGFQLAPTGIETGRGVVALFGFPDLVNLEKSPFADAITPPQSVEKGPIPRFAARARLIAGVQDRLDVHWKHEDVDVVLGRDCKEWVLEPDETVCVFGQWDGGRLVPSARRPRGLPVYKGSPDEVLEILWGNGRVFIAFGAIALAMAVALAIWFLR